MFKAILHRAITKDQTEVAAQMLTSRYGADAVAVVDGPRVDANPDPDGALVLTTLQHAGRLATENKAGPGFWYRPDAMRVTSWMPHFVDVMLNDDGAVVPWGVLIKRQCRHADDCAERSTGKIFIKPADGVRTKPFPGQSIDWYNGRQSMMQMSQIQDLHGLDPTTPVFVAAAKWIPDVEWRFWIVNRAVAAWTPYSWTEVPAGVKVPKKALELAETLAEAKWQPDIAWVADIVETGTGQTASARLIEVNAASTSGVYQADLSRLLPALADAMEAEVRGDLTLGDF